MNDTHGMIWVEFCFDFQNRLCFSVPVIQHDGRSLEKIFLSATLVGCFASKYTIILFLVRVRNTANTSTKHGVHPEQNVDTPET